MSWLKSILPGALFVLIGALLLHTPNSYGNQRMITKIVVHSTATPPAMDVGVTEIDQWHRERGWLGIGYHWVIRRDGTVEQGRSEPSKGAHVLNHNSESIGVALVGGADKDGNPVFNYTYRQMNALLTLLLEIERRHPTILSVTGHSDLDNGKADPMFDVEVWYE